MYPILHYNDLDTKGLETKIKKITQTLSTGNFATVDVKKMKPSNYYRAKLDDSNRLLFTLAKKNGVTHLLILEVIRHHNYDRSRFLSGGDIEIERTEKTISIDENSNFAEIKSVATNNKVHLLDKFIVFDDDQDCILSYPLPQIIIGSAGSGKTSVTLEKLKTLEGKVLYTSLSSYLVSHTKRTYYAHNYKNEDQEIDFLSLEEFLQTIEIPAGQEITSNAFMAWFSRQGKNKHCKDGRKLFEEIRGVITGSIVNKPYLSETEYIGLGVKQSIYPQDLRHDVYGFFKKYLAFLKHDGYYDSNIVASEYHSKVEPEYDAIVVDEIQDFTNSQLSVVLKSLVESGQFLLCGDANQIVHPNFFSWSKLKSFFYKGSDIETHNIIRVLTKNYRNTPEVTELANRVLKLKNYRFGSIDKESHYLVESVTKTHGEVSSLLASNAVIKDINTKTSTSVHYAVIVLHENDKKMASRCFDTPLIFTVQEAKGLEYENIILYNMVSSDQRYHEIAKGLTLEYLDAEFDYSRAKDKTDKSLEIYKFYINALYVAITRAIKNVYILEEDPHHRFLQLLQINTIEQVTIENAKSSAEEWQKEASKLAEQGKEDQARAIEEKLLKRKPVPWKVLDNKAYEELYKLALIDKKASKKEYIKLLNYAMIYNNEHVISTLKKMEVKAAYNLSKCLSIMEDEYFRDYSYKNDTIMLNKINMYGLEYRNAFNMTPLMCAAYTGNDKHVNKLIELGASLQTIDNNGRTSLMIALIRAYKHSKYAANKLPSIYDLLCPDALSIEINRKLIKIDKRKAEFFILLQLLTLVKLQNINLKFTALGLAKYSETFADKILVRYRKKNTYISSILSKNEISGSHKYNLRLFVRIKRGVYTLPQNIQLKSGNQWLSF